MALTNVQYDEIMRTYDENQIRRAHLIRTRKEALYRKIPRIAEIDREIAHSSVTQARRMLDGDQNALSALSSHIAALTDEKKKLFLSHGISADYLDPPYQCPDCRDTGFIGTEQCYCFRQKAIELVYTQSDLSEILEKENFGTFSLEYYSDQDIDPHSGISALEYARRAESKCFQFARTFDQSCENLLLQGETGTGKTFLTHCVAKELLDSGHSVIYLTATPRRILFRQFFDNAISLEADFVGSRIGHQHPYDERGDKGQTQAFDEQIPAVEDRHDPHNAADAVHEQDRAPLSETCAENAVVQVLLVRRADGLMPQRPSDDGHQCIKDRKTQNQRRNDDDHQGRALNCTDDGDGRNRETKKLGSAIPHEGLRRMEIKRQKAQTRACQDHHTDRRQIPPVNI